MKPSYRKEKDNDYMILEAPGNVEGVEYQIRMLLLNPIYGLIPCKMRMVDGSRAFYYDITEKQPMTSVFERRLMGKKDIEKLLGGLEKAMDEAGRYLLLIEQFVLKPDYIFQDTETEAFLFCYLPFYDGSLEADFRELAEYILKRLDHSQEEAVLWGYDIYSRSAEEHFSIGKILESVHERAAKEAARKAREMVRQTKVPYEERQKPEEEIAYIEVEEGALEEMAAAYSAAGRMDSRVLEKAVLREEKAEKTEKAAEKGISEKRNTEGSLGIREKEKASFLEKKQGQEERGISGRASGKTETASAGFHRNGGLRCSSSLGFGLSGVEFHPGRWYPVSVYGTSGVFYDCFPEKAGEKNGLSGGRSAFMGTGITGRWR